MARKKHTGSLLIVLTILAAGCAAAMGGGTGTPQSARLPSAEAGAFVPAATPTALPPTDDAGAARRSQELTQTAAPTATIPITATPTEVIFQVGRDITIEYLRDLEISGSEITFEEELAPGYNFHRRLVSYVSDGNKICGLLTIPFAEPPQTGYKAIVFNHGYIPPTEYRTTERYNAYVNYLAASGFVVFKIDYRGHGESEGEPSGSYFSPGYTIDSIAAFKSLQMLDFIDPEGIGMWGHSMAGNVTLRAMLVEPGIKAGVIWAGAVYSYDDFAEYGINDNTYRPPATPEGSERPRRSRELFDTYGRPDTRVDYWKAVSLTENIELLQRPLQIHHAEDDPVVNIGYSIGLATALQEHGKEYEFYTYEGGGHNLVSPYFDQAMRRTVEFFRDNLSLPRDGGLGETAPELRMPASSVEPISLGIHTGCVLQQLPDQSQVTANSRSAAARISFNSRSTSDPMGSLSCSERIFRTLAIAIPASLSPRANHAS